MTAHQWLWFDLETTGLDAHKGLILEFAAVLCEDARGDDFAIVHGYETAIHYDPDTIALIDVDPYVRDMHTRNGLWDDVATSTVSLRDADEFLTAIVADLAPDGRPIMLAGCSVHFDLAWSRVHLPSFAGWVHHRVLDVSALMSAVDAWAPDRVAWPRSDAHRAMQDVQDAIAKARLARHAMGW